MRLRNIKEKEKIISDSKYIIMNPKEKKGCWNSVFSNNNPIHIEIGMGKGKFICEMAKKYPNINFIGIEKFDNVIVRAIQKLEEEEISNLKLIRIDALELNEVFYREIDRIYLNFSDPWPKARHEKRRLTSSIFLEIYDLLFKSDCTIHLKTDNKDLFAYSLVSLYEYGYQFQSVTLDLANENIENVTTEYEERFMNVGTTINRLEARKKS